MNKFAKKPKINIPILVEVDFKNELQELAKKHDKSRSGLIVELIKIGLNHTEEMGANNE